MSRYRKVAAFWLCGLLFSTWLAASQWLGPREGPPARSGMQVSFLAADFRNGGVVGVYRSFERAAKMLGWQVHAVDGRGDPVEIQRLAAQILKGNPDGVVLGGFDPQVLGGLVDNFKARKIALVGWHAGDNPGPSDKLFSNITSDPLQVADLAVEYAMRDGPIGVVIFTDSQFAIATSKTERMAKRLQQCTQCRLLSIEDVPISAAGKNMDERVRSLQRRFGSEWTHTLAINDVYFDHINVPLNALGRKDVRNISAGDGSAKALGRILSGLSQQVATVAEPLGVQGWQLVDELNRAFAGAPASQFVSAPLLITPAVLQESEDLSIELDFNHEDAYLRLWRQAE
ncbi:MAG: substrate-binding domain-containing protein [Pseudomonas sp.]|uniref:substrate-binding domain-containing protein n=1 Tax=Pseudomonas sp. TaxID=306 RepID=UPI00398221D4